MVKQLKNKIIVVLWAAGLFAILLPL